MKTIWIATTIWAALNPAQEKLTLDKALRIARVNSFAVKIAESNLTKTKERINEAKGAVGPKVNAQATYTRFDKATTANIGGNNVTISPIDQKQAVFTLTVPIDITGVIGRSVEAARKAERANEEQIRAAENDLRRDVRSAYFTVLQTEAQVGVAKDALARAELQLKNARTEFERGSKAKVDVLRFETLVSQARTELLVAENSAQLSKQALNNVMGRAIETPVEVAEVNASPTPDWTEDSLVQASLASRPELRAIGFQIEALQNIQRAQEGGLKPSLSLSANHTRNIDAQGFSSRDTSTTGTLALSLPLFDSGITRAKVSQAREDVRQAQIQLEQAKLGISLEVRQAITNLLNAKSRLEVAEKQVAFAQETYDIALLRDQVGEGIALQVIDAQAELTRAKSGLISARYDFHKAFAALQRAIGSDDLKPMPKEGKTN
ncbi:MAG TPA: TolC family protein [Fimbriimonadaceae bacterium]|nr:TolC family protein [Fimbriimonadaceae bacterium]